MENSLPSEQKSEIRNLDGNRRLRQHKLELMSRFMENKSHNPESVQKQIVQPLSYSHSTTKKTKVRETRQILIREKN